MFDEDIALAIVGNDVWLDQLWTDGDTTIGAHATWKPPRGQTREPSGRS